MVLLHNENQIKIWSEYKHEFKYEILRDLSWWKSIEKNVETQNLASPDVRSFLISQAKRRKILRLYLDDIEQPTYSIITIYFCELIIYILMNYYINFKVII